MNSIISFILYASGVLALYFAFRTLYSEERKYTENKLIALHCIGSGIWSFGFGGLFAQTDPEIAYYCRSLGMIGTFLYLIVSQMLVCYISGIPKKLKLFLNGFACLGIPLYFLTIQKDETVYYLSDIGMTYSFQPGIANTLYTAYTVLLILFILIVVIYMIRFSKVKRIQAFGKRFLGAVVLMTFGTILDTFLPSLGMAAIPGSTLTQFWGSVVLYIAVRANNRSKINIENMSQFIYYSLSIPVLVYDSSFRLQILNGAAAEFLNPSKEETVFTNNTIDKIFEVTDADAFLFEGNHKNIDSICKNNRITCNLAISKIHDRYNDTIGFIIIVTDLSERIKTMQKLEIAKQEAEAASLAKSTFLANMSHEIRTPMNAILGFSELVLKMDVDTTVRDYVSDIKSSCQNLLAVVNDILDISKLESGKMELSLNHYYTNSLLQDVYHIINVQAREKGLRFRMETDSHIPHELYGDKTRIRGILINVLNNAVKYTNEGGITFHVNVVGKENGAVTLKFTISDTGIGIREEAKEHLFESFSRFDQKKNYGIEGTGLGLAIVYGYLQLMGGTVTVDSTYGKGSTFTIVLSQKIINENPMGSIKTVDSISSLNEREIKILDTKVLAVDDNQINLRVIRGTLEYYGFKVDTASSGADAIALCSQTQYDLVFMDQMMPRMDGIETMGHIRTLSPHYAVGGKGKIIVLTANAIAGMRRELMDKGFDEYLGKPINFRELERVISTFIPPEKIVTQLGAKDTIPEKPKEAPSLATELPAPATEAPAPAYTQNRQAVFADLVPELEYKLGLEHCGGEESVYMEILQLLHASGAEQLSQLKMFYNTKNQEQFTILIHSLKGQLLNVGHTRLSEFAKELEYASREGRQDFIEAHINRFLQKYEEFLNMLGNAFQKLS